MAIKEFQEIPLKSKHVKWNCEESEDNFHMNIPLTRCYFAIVDKRFAYRKEISNKIQDQMIKVNSWVIPIKPEVDFKVKNSEWGLLFVVYDALVSPESLNFHKLGIKNKRDYKMSKKEVLNVEDYLRRVYE
jgi:hypothetical protein